MQPSRILVGAALGLAVVGSIDAAIEASWDHVAIFLAIVAALAIVIVASMTHRRIVSLRSDLHRALRRRSDLDGEPVEVLLDRAVAFEVRMRERESWSSDDR